MRLPTHPARTWDYSDIKTNLEETPARILRFNAMKAISLGHTLDLEIYRIGYSETQEIFPLVVNLTEVNGQKGQVDFYQFENNGKILVHRAGFWQGKNRINYTSNDRNLDRLCEHGESIAEMIKSYQIPSQIFNHPVILDLRKNVFGR